MTTDTPRTDAAEPQLHSNVGGWVRADFARELERELEELQQQKRNCIEILDDDAKEIAELKAEVERLTKRPFGCKCETLRERAVGDGCDECNKTLAIEMLRDERDELEAEVERLTKELDAWDYGTRAKREQARAEKAEAEVERLQSIIRTYKIPS